MKQKKGKKYRPHRNADDKYKDDGRKKTDSYLKIFWANIVR